MGLVPCIYSAWLSCIVSWSTAFHAGSIEQSSQRHARSCQTSQLKPSTQGLCIVSSQHNALCNLAQNVKASGAISH